MDNTLVEHVYITLAELFLTTCTFDFEDEVEHEEFLDLCDFWFPFFMFLCLNFDVSCSSFHQYRHEIEAFLCCSYLNFDVNH